PISARTLRDHGEAAHEKTRKRFTINAKTSTNNLVSQVKHPIFQLNGDISHPLMAFNWREA
ncbi:hypothetical protein LMH73_000775, partial [Vibrio splendidus]